MNNKSISKSFLAFLIIAGFFCFSGCKKDFDKVGASVIPGGSNPGVLFNDTSTLLAHSVRIDSLRTDETINNMLGSMLDPVFGHTSASFSAQYRLVNKNHDFGENPVLDSVILVMRYADYYGDTTTPLTLRVYEVSQTLYKDSVYFSNNEIQNYGFDYADYTFYPQPGKKETVIIDEDTTVYAPRIRINLGELSNEIGNKIINADSMYLADNENFNDYFKGLQFAVDNVAANGSVLSFDLMSSPSSLIIYYHIDTNNYAFPLVVNENSARINHFSHDYQLADQDFYQQVISENPDTTLGKKTLYLQSMAGAKTIIRFPHIHDFFNTERVIINEAKIVLPVKGQELMFKEPEQLGLLRFNDEGNSEFIVDELEGSAFFDGTFDSVSNSYQFRITRYIQQLMLNELEDYGLSLFINGSSSYPYRLILAGTDPESYVPDLDRLKLELRYTLVK